MQGHMHHKRRLLIALVATGGFSVGLTSFAVTANAQPRTFVVTVVGNIKKTITVDVGATTPIDQIKLPSILGLPILDITEITPGGTCRPGCSGGDPAEHHRGSVRGRGDRRRDDRYRGAAHDRQEEARPSLR